MDISRGLLAEVEILCNEHLLIQRLDYLHVPFRCSCCHAVGHLRNSCPNRFSGRDDPGIVDSRSYTPPASPSVGQHLTPGNTFEPLSPTDVVSDSFLEAVDDLIMTHKKSSVPPLSSLSLLVSPPRLPLMAQDLSLCWGAHLNGS